MPKDQSSIISVIQKFSRQKLNFYSSVLESSVVEISVVESSVAKSSEIKNSVVKSSVVFLSFIQIDFILVPFDRNVVKLVFWAIFQTLWVFFLTRSNVAVVVSIVQISQGRDEEL